MSSHTPPKKKPLSSEADPFTTDSGADGGDEIPSVTKLLNRKSLAQVLKKDTPSTAVPPSSTPTRPQIKKSVSSSALPDAPPSISLQIWTPEILKHSTDPLALGLHSLFQSGGALQALFLSIAPPTPGSLTPLFKAKAAHAPPSKIALWSGMTWDPQWMPEVWNAIVSTGWVELSPPEAHTNVKSKRNIIRNSFGTQPEEWMTLIRVGPPKQCRGILAVISHDSILNAIRPQMSVFSTLPGGS